MEHDEERKFTPALHIFDDGTEYFECVVQFPRMLTDDETTVLADSIFHAFNHDKMFRNLGVSSMSKQSGVEVSFSLDRDVLDARALLRATQLAAADERRRLLLELGAAYVF